MAQPDKQLRQLLDILDAVEDAPGSLGEILQQAQVGLVGSDAHGGDRNSLAAQVRNKQIVFVILSIGIAVGEQNNLAYRKPAFDQIRRRDFQRLFEVGASSGLQPHDFLLQLRPVHAQRMQPGNHVRL